MIMTSEDGSAYANGSDPQIPARFTGIIAMIDGLDNIRHSRPLAIRISPLSGSAFKPSDFYTFYNEQPLLNSGINGADPVIPKPGSVRRPCMALVEDFDFLDAAVAKFNTTYSLPDAQIERLYASHPPPHHRNYRELVRSGKH